MKQKSKNKKCRSLIKKMNHISNDIRDTILLAYLKYVYSRHILARYETYGGEEHD